MHIGLLHIRVLFSRDNLPLATDLPCLQWKHCFRYFSVRLDSMEPWKCSLLFYKPSSSWTVVNAADRSSRRRNKLIPTTTPFTSENSTLGICIAAFASQAPHCCLPVPHTNYAYMICWETRSTDKHSDTFTKSRPPISSYLKAADPLLARLSFSISISHLQPIIGNEILSLLP